MLQQYLPFTVLKRIRFLNIETEIMRALQQYLPFTVLKLNSLHDAVTADWLQQYLPFTVLKHQEYIYSCH